MIIRTSQRRSRKPIRQRVEAQLLALRSEKQAQCDHVYLRDKQHGGSQCRCGARRSW